MVSKLTFCKLIKQTRKTQSKELFQILEEDSDVVWNEELREKAFDYNISPSEVWEELINYILRHNKYLRLPVYRVADLIENIFDSSSTIVLMEEVQDEEDSSTYYYEHIWRGQAFNLKDEKLLNREFIKIYSCTRSSDVDDAIYIEVGHKILEDNYVGDNPNYMPETFYRGVNDENYFEYIKG